MVGKRKTDAEIKKKILEFLKKESQLYDDSGVLSTLRLATLTDVSYYRILRLLLEMQAEGLIVRRTFGSGHFWCLIDKPKVIGDIHA